jgi:rhodanese-related sulfurtransferase
MTQSDKGYAGDVSAREAWDMLAKDSSAVLIDCRSSAEWTFVGIADLSSLNRKPALIAWQAWQANPRPGMVANPQFTDDVAKLGVTPDTRMIFMCRSGGRSMAAAIAMTKKGFHRCYNMTGGFEGGHDPKGRRGTSAGWKAAGLPWAQE